MIRTEAGMPITRFTKLVGMPRRTYTRRRSRWLRGEPEHGPWPAPVVDAIEADVAKIAETYPAWGHRKIWALYRAEHPDQAVSMSSVERAMRRRGLLQPARYQAERRQLAAARRAAFVVPPSHRNQVWQLDFTEYETSSEAVWRIAGAADYFAKYEFGWHLATTQNANDAIAALETARIEAERLIGVPLIVDITDPETGEIHPVVVVTDNGPAFKSASFARYIASRSEFTHVRTRRRSPHTNGVRERAYGSLKYEHLYRYEIADGVALAGHAEDYRRLFNEIRPHEHLDWSTPKEVYLTAEPNFPAPETEPLS